MLDMMKRHEIQVLRKAGHSQLEVAKLAGTSERTVRRVEDEPDVRSVEPGEAQRRGIGRPPKAEAFRPFVTNVLAAEPDVLEIVCTNTVPIAGEKRVPKLTVLSIAPGLAEAMRRSNSGESVSALFHSEPTTQDNTRTALRA